MIKTKLELKKIYKVEYIDEYGNQREHEFEDEKLLDYVTQKLTAQMKGGFDAQYEKLAAKLDEMERPDYYPEDQVREELTRYEFELLKILPKLLKKNILIYEDKGERFIDTSCNDHLIQIIRLFHKMGWFNTLSGIQFGSPRPASDEELIDLLCAELKKNEPEDADELARILLRTPKEDLWHDNCLGYVNSHGLCQIGEENHIKFDSKECYQILKTMEKYGFVKEYGEDHFLMEWEKELEI